MRQASRKTARCARSASTQPRPLHNDSPMRLATFIFVTLLAKSALAALPQLVIGTGAPAQLGGIQVAPQDLVQCGLDAAPDGAPACRWSKFFDGKLSGLQTTIGALDVLS